ncbi:MAG: hypothetical protein WAU21_08600 [Chitinophagales bacterium]|nr:hypothetical protein [Bacteroidota bacterium]MBK8486382.1 hypothetical protein [Bacteroidota bacterium]
MKIVINIKALHHNPIGMLTPGRNWSAGSEYRFGFNGKESDSEMNGDGNAFYTFAKLYIYKS